jgi:hypothetical protein
MMPWRIAVSGAIVGAGAMSRFANVFGNVEYAVPVVVVVVTVVLCEHGELLSLTNKGRSIRTK